MGRALILILIAVVVALTPVPRLLRAAVASVLVVAAIVFAWFVEQDQLEQRTEVAESQAAEEALWHEPQLGDVRITSWQVFPPLRFHDRWRVEATARLAGGGLDRISGVEIEATARDCPPGATALTACPVIGSSLARRTFRDLGRSPDPSVRMRFEFTDAPYPAGRLRLLPAITRVRSLPDAGIDGVVAVPGSAPVAR